MANQSGMVTKTIKKIKKRKRKNMSALEVAQASMGIKRK